MRRSSRRGTRARRAQLSSSSSNQVGPLAQPLGYNPGRKGANPRRSAEMKPSGLHWTLNSLIPKWLWGQRRSTDDERGSGTVLIAGVIAALFSLAIAGTVVTIWVATIQQARNVADLAASAAAQARANGRPACDTGAEVARKNGATLAVCRVNGNSQAFDVLIEVEIELRPRIPGFPTEVTGRARAGTIA